MFKLCNIDNIGEEYADKKEMGESSFQNLLDDISDTVDTYLKKEDNPVVVSDTEPANSNAQIWVDIS